MLKNGPRGKCLQERSYHKKLSNTPLIYGDSFILLYNNYEIFGNVKKYFWGKIFYRKNHINKFCYNIYGLRRDNSISGPRWIS